MADPVRDRPGPDYPGLIKQDRVHGSLYTDPRVVADELAGGQDRGPRGRGSAAGRLRRANSRRSSGCRTAT